jgi:predicted acylesterase/phospholipase RssA
MSNLLFFRPLIAKLSVITVLAFVSTGSINGQTAAAKRPSVGVVLSGGGAKGIAHIGVLKVLEEVGIPVDYIAGTSMGSIIGGLYATGYDAGRLETITTGQNWNKLLSDNISRTDLSIEEKKRRGHFFRFLSIWENRGQDSFRHHFRSEYRKSDEHLVLSGIQDQGF